MVTRTRPMLRYTHIVVFFFRIPFLVYTLFMPFMNIRVLLNIRNVSMAILSKTKPANFPGCEDKNVLRKIVTDRRFLNYLNKQTNHFCHASALEPYHMERLNPVPKRNDFRNSGVATTVLVVWYTIAEGREETSVSLRTVYTAYSSALPLWRHHSCSKPL